MPKRSQKSGNPRVWLKWWTKLNPQRRRRTVLGMLGFFALLVVVAAAVIGFDRLEAHVMRLKLAQFPQAQIVLLDLPKSLEKLAAEDLFHSLEDILDHRWTNDQLCELMAARLQRLGWIESLHFVRRTSDARFEISAAYRLPAAMVQHGDDYYLVDAQRVRLPGVYRHDPVVPLIQGVEAEVPEPGVVWPGNDLHAAVAVLAIVCVEPFARQITAVMVHNYGGRVNPLASHIELATDRPGGRIRWGSPPGLEVEENSTEQKLTLMRVNYRTTGRPDANHPIIDVSTHSNRYSVPG